MNPAALEWVETAPDVFANPQICSEISATFLLAGQRAVDPCVSRGDVLVRLVELLFQRGWKVEEIVAAVEGWDRDPRMLEVARAKLDAWAIVRIGPEARIDWRLLHRDVLDRPRDKRQPDLFAPQADLQRFDVVVSRPRRAAMEHSERAALRRKFESAVGRFSYDLPVVESMFELAASHGHVIAEIDVQSFSRGAGRRFVDDVLPHVEITDLLVVAADRPQEVVMVGTGGIATGRHMRVMSVLEDRLAEVGRAFGGQQLLGTSDVRRQPRSAGAFWAAIKLREESDLLSRLNRASRTLQDVLATEPGRTTTCGMLDVWRTHSADYSLPYVRGGGVTDWLVDLRERVWFPYSARGTVLEVIPETMERELWPYQRELSARRIFGQTVEEREVPWWSHLEHYPTRLGEDGLVVSGASGGVHVAVVNTRALYASSAPVIRIDHSDTRHGVAALLSSSLGSFWLQRTMFNRDSLGFEVSTRRLAEFPLPAELGQLPEMGRRLHKLSLSLNSDGLDRSWQSILEGRKETLRRMVSIQEQIDWEVYRLFGLVEQAPTVPGQLDPDTRDFAATSARLPVSADDALEILETESYKRAWRILEDNLDPMVFLRQKIRSAVARFFSDSVNRARPVRLTELSNHVLKHQGIRSAFKHVGNDDAVSDILLDGVGEFSAVRRLTPAGLKQHRSRVSGDGADALTTEDYQEYACVHRQTSAAATRQLHWAVFGGYETNHSDLMIWGELSDLLDEPVFVWRASSIEEQARWFDGALKLNLERAFYPSGPATASDPGAWGLIEPFYFDVFRQLSKWVDAEIAQSLRRRLREFMEADASVLDVAYRQWWLDGGGRQNQSKGAQADLASLAQLIEIIESGDRSMREIAEQMRTFGWRFEETRAGIQTLVTLGRVQLVGEGPEARLQWAQLRPG